MMEEYLTPEEVATRLKLSLITVNRWLTAGKLPGYKVGRQWRVKESELIKFIESQEG